MAPSVSHHGPEPDSLPSDTPSASSGLLEHDDVPSASPQFYLLNQQPLQQPHHQPADSFSQRDHTPLHESSDTDSTHALSSRQSVTDSSRSSASISTTTLTSPPIGFSAAAGSTHSLPPPFRNPIRRKPLSSSASSLAVSPKLRDSTAIGPTSLDLQLSPGPDQRFARPPSIDSPTFYDYPHSVRDSEPSCESPVSTLVVAHALAGEAHSIPAPECQGGGDSAEPSDGDVLSAHSEIASQEVGLSDPDEHLAQSSLQTNTADDDSKSGEEQSLNSSASVVIASTPPPPPPTPITNPTTTTTTTTTTAALSPSPPTPPPAVASTPPPPAPHLTLKTVQPSTARSGFEINQRQPATPDSSKLAVSPQLNKPLPKSPGQTSPFASLFGWPNISPSVSEFSSIPSLYSPTSKNANDLHQSLRNTRSTSSSSNIDGATSNPIDYCESYLSTPPPGTLASSVQIDEMEDELKAISSELAASIRREMDLEDLVDRLQEQVNNPQAPGKRSSDYFSDSGYSSAKTSEYDHGKEEIEKIQRRSEQEKASIRLELGDKLQDERSRRKILDQQIKDLSEKASQMDLAHMNSLDANDRVRELERACEDLRRRLSEERGSKNNFEDLLSGLKSELQEACNERDNLRDEVVPQLRARVEGLEAEAASYANLTYESTKMQQQLQTLKQENTSLRKSSNPEDVATNSAAAVSTSKAKGFLGFGGLTRTASVKNAQSESKEAMAERLKDVEAQRDALHSALKNLLERQEFQNRENEKKIKVLEAERQRLLLEPRKAGFDKEISSLRSEISVLRRRAEEALEQKWQVEKGLSGLKMNLDKAEAEIASLRSLLQEKDILITPSSGRSQAVNGPGPLGASATSESLQRAYRDLQTAYSESLERIKKLELGSGDVSSDSKTKLAIERLEKSLSLAVSERDAARRHLDGLKKQVSGLSDGECENVKREMALADQLGESAQRIEQLAAQVQAQLTTNAELRKRLAETVARGDSDRKASSDRITELQARLHKLEEQLVAAQTASEDRVGRHEDELSQLKEAHNDQLQRIQKGGAVGVTARKGALLNTGGWTSFFGGGRTQTVPPKSFEDEAEVKTLRTRISELEQALNDAESEIQQVVAKMNEAQIEVLTLQEEREAAARETRQLQKTLEQAKLTPP